MSTTGRKALPVCEACRTRKVKCDSHGDACKECTKLDLECVRTSAIRFKHHRLNNGPQDRVEFPPGQAWALPRTTLRYHDETPNILGLYKKELDLPYGSTTAAPESAPVLVGLQTSKHQSDGSLEQRPCGGSLGEAGAATDAVSLPVLASSKQDNGILPMEVQAQDSRSPWHPPVSSTNPSPMTRSVPSLSRTEALLLRNFADHMALWADGTDQGRSFEFEATRLALTNPVLLYAICAFSSRHIHRDDPSKDDVALQYQNLCLQLLIPAISDPKTVDVTTLAAVAILRQNEEMDEDDGRFHLEGVTRLLDHKSDFLRSGGLGEATGWLCLREDIYISLLTETPVRSSLDIFSNASWLQGESDAAWTNRMVLLLARLLCSVHDTNTDVAAEDHLKDCISDWYHSKPVSFQPIHYLPRSPTDGRALPEIWMLASFHAVSLQYYYIAQLVQLVSARKSSFKSNQEHQPVEQKVHHYLLHVVGIAASTVRAENTWFTAHHCLAVWGGFLREQGDQRACLDFLWKMERKTGWRVGRLARQLRSHWEKECS